MLLVAVGDADIIAGPPADSGLVDDPQIMAAAARPSA